VQIDENVYREIVNHRSLRHPNIIQFIEVRAPTRIAAEIYPLFITSILSLLGSLGCIISRDKKELVFVASVQCECFCVNSEGWRKGKFRRRWHF
jgi:hypothetical protein